MAISYFKRCKVAALDYLSDKAISTVILKLAGVTVG